MPRRMYAERLQLWKELKDQLTGMTGLPDLPLVCEIVLEAHYERGQSMRAIANEMGKSYYMVRHYHDRGLYLLKQHLHNYATH